MTGTVQRYPVGQPIASGRRTILWADLCHTVPRMPVSRFPGTSLPTARRISFGRVTEHLEVPNLLAIQTESFDWLVGNDAWQTRSADDPHARSGLAEILEEISPI